MNSVSSLYGLIIILSRQVVNNFIVREYKINLAGFFFPLDLSRLLLIINSEVMIMAQAKADMIAQDLADKIKHKLYEPGTFLPSESQLTELYGTSRETVRKALRQLQALGLIQPIRGKGSIVLDLARYAFPISGITSFAELAKQQGMNAVTEVVEFREAQAIPTEIARFFTDSENENLQGTYLERLRTIDGTKAVLDCDFVLNPPIKEIPLKAAQTSLYHYFEEDLGLNISYATKEITVQQAPERVKQLMDLPGDEIVVVASRNFLDDTTLFQLTVSCHRPDKFKFVDFARRKQIKF